MIDQVVPTLVARRFRSLLQGLLGYVDERFRFVVGLLAKRRAMDRYPPTICGISLAERERRCHQVIDDSRHRRAGQTGLAAHVRHRQTRPLIFDQQFQDQPLVSG